MAKLSKMVSTAGLSACSFIRVCGSLKLDNKTTLRLAKKAGFDPAAGTVGIQAKKGRDGEAVPKIAGDLKAKIKSLASKTSSNDDNGSEEQTEQPETEAKASKKGEGKEGKSSKKKKKSKKNKEKVAAAAAPEDEE